MTYLFNSQTPEWKYVGEAIERYLEYCHNIKSTSNNNPDVIIIPLFENVNEPLGLDSVASLRKEKGNAFSVVFLVLSLSDIPRYFHPEEDMASHAEKIIKNPEFGDARKSIFLAELRYDKETKKYENIIDLSQDNALKKIAGLVKRPPSLLPSQLLNKYYNTFIEYYDPFGLIDERGSFNIKMYGFLKDILKKHDELCKDKLTESRKELKDIICDGIKVEEFLKLANRIYNCLNNVEEKDKGGHTVSLELFRAPVPFPLQELFDFKVEIEDELRKGGAKNNIKLLLVDNKLDKVVVKDGEDNFYEGKLIDVLFDRQYCSMFELRMLGDGLLNSISQKMELPMYVAEYKELMKSECFNSREFKTSLNQFISLKRDVPKKEKSKYYAWRVYDKIRSSQSHFVHFVLLDFFLNEENTYLAFDFIKDIAEIKRKERDPSTTWYFITSAVYDSVVKYSQSGLLAEYYESAVVNAGDDPTNEKRQIIFVYKLLTFIQARIRSFKGFKKSIVDSKLLTCKMKADDCIEKRLFKDCLIKQNQSLFRKYLAEYSEIIKIFPGQELSEEEFKKTVELLDSTVNQFFWLPEADWPMMQRQVEHINSRLEHIEDFKVKERRFLCSYILEEIKKRSEIY